MHRSRRGAGLTALLALFLSPVVALGAEGVSAPLLVQETAGLRRTHWPVTVGVPAPRGWVRGGQTVHVVDATNKPLPTQVRVLGNWPGSADARWLLLDFQTDLDPRQKREVAVRAGPGPAANAKVDVRQTGGNVEIDTGVLRLLVGAGSGGMFRLQSLYGKPLETDPVRVELVSGARTYAASAPEVAIEERGPLRTRIRLRGRYGNGFAYEVRLQAFAGQPYLRLQHTFLDLDDEAVTPLERLSVQVPAPGKSERSYAALLAAGGKLEGRIEAKGISLAQVDAATMRRGDQSQAGRLSGWFELRGDVSVGLDVPFFWQEFPQAVHLGGHGLTYDLWADTGGGPAAIGVGAAKTHEFYVVYGRGTDLIDEPGRGVTALADPTWTANSGALLNAVDPHREPQFVNGATSAFERVARSIDVEVWDQAGACPESPAPRRKQTPGATASPHQLESAGREIRRVGAYGMLNWGDWNYRGYHDDTKGCDAWGNQEYDLTQVLGLLFAASGRPEVQQFLVAAARHFGDVDVIHRQPQHPEWVGMNHPKNPWHFSFAHGGVDLGHTWVEGLFTYHFLTGEPRAWEAAVGISDYLVRRLRTTVRGNPRQFGWPALALAVAYEATGTAGYRDAALDYATRGTKAHPVPEQLGTNWKLGVLADAVSYVHAVTGDAGLRDWLVRYAGLVVKSHPQDARYYPAVAYVGRLAADAAVLESARRAADRIVFGDWAKPFTIAARTGFRILSLLDAPAK